MIKYITFDFDNTIIFSENIKSQAWFDLTPKFIHPRLKELLNLKTLNRYQIFHQLKEQFPVIDSNLLEIYNHSVHSKLKKKGFIKGFKSFLHDVKNYDLFINSLAPTFYIKEILAPYETLFKGIYGDEDHKLNHFYTIQEQTQSQPKEILFIGDSISDFETSQQFGCLFLGFYNSNLLNYPIPFIKNWSLKNRIFTLNYIKKGSSI